MRVADALHRGGIAQPQARLHRRLGDADRAEHKAGRADALEIEIAGEVVAAGTQRLERRIEPRAERHVGADRRRGALLHRDADALGLLLQPRAFERQRADDDAVGALALLADLDEARDRHVAGGPRQDRMRHLHGLQRRDGEARGDGGDGQRQRKRDRPAAGEDRGDGANQHRATPRPTRPARARRRSRSRCRARRRPAATAADVPGRCRRSPSCAGARRALAEIRQAGRSRRARAGAAPRRPTSRPGHGCRLLSPAPIRHLAALRRRFKRRHHARVCYLSLTRIAVPRQGCSPTRFSRIVRMEARGRFRYGGSTERAMKRHWILCAALLPTWPASVDAKSKSNCALMQRLAQQHSNDMARRESSWIIRAFTAGRRAAPRRRTLPWGARPAPERWPSGAARPDMPQTCGCRGVRPWRLPYRDPAGGTGRC